MAKRTRMPTDVNQRAKAIVDLASSDEPGEQKERLALRDENTSVGTRRHQWNVYASEHPWRYSIMGGVGAFVLVLFFGWRSAGGVLVAVLAGLIWYVVCGLSLSCGPGRRMVHASTPTLVAIKLSHTTL